jgi:carbamoyltransferase
MIILGISGGIGHDPAACIVIDGQLRAMAEEERFTRVKRAPNQMPIYASLYCLKEVGIEISDVDVIATAWDPTLDPSYFLVNDAIRVFKGHKAFQGHAFPPIISIDHHQAHAASSFFASGFSDAAILVVDGQGERVSTTIAHGRNRAINVIQSFGITQSIGNFYGAISTYIGLGAKNPGKTMGLAPYGEPRYHFPQIKLTSDGYEMNISEPKDTPYTLWSRDIYLQWLSIFTELFGPKPETHLLFDLSNSTFRTQLNIDQRLKNIASSAQHVLEELMLHLTTIAVKATGSRNLVLAGGVALNCTANGLIQRSGLVDELYIFPAAHDAGGALGAALALAAQHQEPACNVIDHAYWGPSFNDQDIASSLRTAGLPVTEHNDIGGAVAILIQQGAVVGWFQERMEVGPRALGHRSILASPARVEIRDRVNEVKGREKWRPLAPSMITGEEEKVLGDPFYSPFMLKAALVNPEARNRLAAVTHIDGSTRPQTVTEASGTAFCRLLSCLKEETGIGAVLNTSFNDAHEPIVCTPRDAIKTFVSTSLDVLAIGNYLVIKPSIDKKVE